MEKKSFILYGDYRTQFQMMSREEQGDLIMAIFAYQEEGAVPELSPVVAMAFSFIQKQLDRDAEKYKEICEKRREAGKKGGRPSKASVGEKANGFSEKQREAKEPDTENENGNETETVTENETENVNETGTDTSSTYPPKSPQGAMSLT